MRFRSPKGVPDREVFRETFVDTLRDLAVLGALFGLLLVLSLFWPVSAVVGRWLFFVLGLGVLFQFISTALVGLAESVLEGVREGRVEGSAWPILATLARATELAIVLWMAFFLFRRSGSPT